MEMKIVTYKDPLRPMKPSNLQMPPPEPPTLELLVDSIASGKSTWTRMRADQGWLTVNNDSLVRSMHGGQYAWDIQVPGLVELLANWENCRPVLKISFDWLSGVRL